MGAVGADSSGCVKLITIFWGGDDDIDGVRRRFQGVCLWRPTRGMGNDSSEKMMHWRVESTTEECMAANFGMVDAFRPFWSSSARRFACLLDLQLFPIH